MDKVKIFALGGLDENGKNLTVVEVNDVIFILECGIKIPPSGVLGVEFIIPDFTYLIENQHRIGGIFITHGHDDVMRALPYLLKQLDVTVPIYTGAFSVYLIEKQIKKENVTNYKLIKLKRNAKIKVNGIEVRTFALSHAIPDTYGVAIWSDQGYIVFASEFIIDYDMQEDFYYCDINVLSEIGKKGVLCLMTESECSDLPGHTAPKHRIKDKLVPIIEQHRNQRIIIAIYKQSIYRVFEILQIAKQFKKKVVLHDDRLRVMLHELRVLNYLEFPRELLIEKEDYNGEEDVIMIVSGTGKRIFLKMLKIETKEDPLVQPRQSDVIVVAATSITGTEKEAVAMENEIYREGGIVYSLNYREVMSMHPSIDDIKMILYLFKPKYFFPIKGEYRQLLSNANIAVEMGFTPDRVILADNGQVATFVNKGLVSLSLDLDLNDTYVDGDENWDVTGVVLKDREILSKDGVMVLAVALNYRTKEIISGFDVQTRGLIYLKDAEYIVKEVQRIFEETITDSVLENRYENIEIRLEARDKIAKYLMKETGKRPMILPVIMEMNV